MATTSVRRHDVLARPQFLTADWRNLLMLNYEVDPGLLEPLVPVGTELDFHEGRTFVSIVGFEWTKTRVLGVGVPFHRDFMEVNLRYYVRRKVLDEWRRGVVFIKEVVPRMAVAAIARWVYHEKFIARRMTAHVVLPHESSHGAGELEYGWTHLEARNRVRATFHGEPSTPQPGSLEEFIAEHYWGYTRRPDGSSLEYRVEHPAWHVWPASDVDFTCDVASFYGDAYADILGPKPTSAFIADGSGIVVFKGRPLADPR